MIILPLLAGHFCLFCFLFVYLVVFSFRCDDNDAADEYDEKIEKNCLKMIIFLLLAWFIFRFFCCDDNDGGKDDGEKLPENGNPPPLGRELSPGSALCVLSPTTSDNHMIVTIYLLCSFKL